MMQIGIKKLIQSIESYFEVIDNPNISVEESKQSTVKLLLHLTFSLSSFSVISAIIEHVTYNLPGTSTIYLVFYVPLLVAFGFKKSLSPDSITILIIISAFFIAIYILFTEAFFGSSIMIFLTIIVLATFMLGIKQGLISIAICLSFLVLAGNLFVNEFLDINVKILSSYKNWVTWISMIVTFVFIAVVLIISIFLIQRKVLSSLYYAENNAKKTGKIK